MGELLWDLLSSDGAVDFLRLFVLTAGGCSVAALAGIRSPLLLIGFAPLFLAIVSLVSLVATNILQARYSALSFSLAATVLGVALARFFLEAFFWQATSGLLILVALASSTRWVPKFPERIGEDPLLVALAALEVQDGAAPSDARRGLAYPALLALGEDGIILGAMTPLISICVLLVTIHFATTGLGVGPTVRLSAVTVAFALVFSAPIFGVVFTYMNSHGLLALCVAVAAGSSLSALKRLELQSEHLVPLTVSVVVATATRLEGAVMVGLAITPVFFLLQKPDQTWLKLAPAYVGACLTSGVWLTHLVLGGSPLHYLSVPLAVLGVPLIGYIAPKYLQSLRFAVRPSWISAVLVLGALASQLIPRGPENGIRSLGAMAVNLIFGVSGWGLLLVATVFAFFLLRGFRSRMFVTTVRMLFWGFLLVVLMKNLVDLPATTQGFNDSISRSLLHLAGPLVYFWVLVSAKLLSPRFANVPSFVWRPFSLARRAGLGLRSRFRSAKGV